MAEEIKDEYPTTQTIDYFYERIAELNELYEVFLEVGFFNRPDYDKLSKIIDEKSQARASMFNAVYNEYPELRGENVSVGNDGLIKVKKNN